MMDHVERVRVTMSLLPISATQGGACESSVQPMYNKELFTPRTNPCVHGAYTVNVVVVFTVKFDYNDNDSSGGFRNYRRGGAKPGDLACGSPPAGSSGENPVGVWGRSPQKLTAYFDNNYRKHRLRRKKVVKR